MAFVNVVLVTSVVGVLLSIEHTPRFYGMMMLGFVIAILAERFVFADADLRSEATTGMIVIGIAVLLMITRRQESVSYIVGLFSLVWARIDRKPILTLLYKDV